jgi:hypothetical protein
MSSFLEIKIETVGRLASPAIRLAIARGINDAGGKIATRVRRGLREQTDVSKYASITSRTATIRAGAGNLYFAIVAHGKGIPIEEFPVVVTSQGVDAKPWGVDHLFQRSFRERYRGGLRARLSAERFPIRRLYGPSLPRELGKGNIPAIFYDGCAELLPAAIIKSLAMALR